MTLQLNTLKCRVEILLQFILIDAFADDLVSFVFAYLRFGKLMLFVIEKEHF